MSLRVAGHYYRRRLRVCSYRTGLFCVFLLSLLCAFVQAAGGAPAVGCPTGANSTAPLRRKLQAIRKKYLWFNHIPKTGGTSVETLIDACYATSVSGHSRLLSFPIIQTRANETLIANAKGKIANVSNFPRTFSAVAWANATRQERTVALNAHKCQTRLGDTSITAVHCLHRSNALADGFDGRENVATFCSIRHPVDRIVSAYNMRTARDMERELIKGDPMLRQGTHDFFQAAAEKLRSAPPECNETDFNRVVFDWILHGEADNFDIPQSQFYCDLHLCFDRLRSEFSDLVRWTQAKPERLGRSFEHLHGDACEMRNISLQTVHVCSTSNLWAKTILSLNEYYHEDFDLYHSVCNTPN